MAPTERSRLVWRSVAAIAGGIIGAWIGVAEDLSLRLLLLLGAFGAVVAFVIGALLDSLLVYLSALPARRRERRAR
jgi:hypothetical protein